MRRALAAFALIVALIWFTTPAPAVTGTEHVAVILLSFDGTQPWTTSQVQSAANAAAGYYTRDSYGAYTFTTDLRGTYTITPPSICDIDAIRSQARALAGDLSAYQHVAYLFPYLPVCQFAGSGELPGDEIWLNGQISPYLLMHELGHNFGLSHAGGPLNPDSGDAWSVMGFSNVTTFSGWQRAQLGWLTPTAASFGTWTIVPLDSSSGTRLLTYGNLALDYRPETYGVTFRQIDVTPTQVIAAGGTGCSCYYPLKTGQSWQATDGTWFTTLSANSAGATVAIGSTPATTTTTTTSTTTTTRPPATTTTTRCKKHC